MQVGGPQGHGDGCWLGAKATGSIQGERWAAASSHHLFLLQMHQILLGAGTRAGGCLSSGMLRICRDPCGGRVCVCVHVYRAIKSLC